MTNQNTAEAVIMFRAKDEASADIAEVRDEIEKTDRSFGGLSKSTAALGLALFGFAQGLKDTIAQARMLSELDRNLAATFKILAPQMAAAFSGLNINQLSRDFAVNESDIRTIANVFARNAGDMELTSEQMAEAIRRTFGLMALSGADAATAAAAVGQAYQGNETDLQKLADASGRMRISMEDLDEASRLYLEGLSGLDKAGGFWVRFREELGKLANQFVENPFNWLVDLFKGAWNDSIGAGIALLNEMFSSTLPKLLQDAVEGVGRGATKIGQAINTHVWDPVHSFFTGTFMNFFKQGIPNAFNTVYDKFKEIGGNVADFFTDNIFEPVATFFTETLPGWFKDLDFSFISNIGTAIGDLFADNIFGPIETFFTETLPGWLKNVVPGLLPDWFKDMFGIDGGGQTTAGVPSGGAGTTGVTVNFNNTVIDSPERQAEVTRQVHRALGEVNRRGLGLA